MKYITALLVACVLMTSAFSGWADAGCQDDSSLHTTHGHTSSEYKAPKTSGHMDNMQADHDCACVMKCHSPMQLLSQHDDPSLKGLLRHQVNIGQASVLSTALLDSPLKPPQHA